MEKLPPSSIRRLRLHGTFPDNESLYQFINDNVIKEMRKKDVTVQTVKDHLKIISTFEFHMLYVSRRVRNDFTKVTDSFLHDPSLEEKLENSQNIAEHNDQDSGDEDNPSTPGRDLRVDVMLLFIRITPEGPDVFVATSGYAYRIIKDKYWDEDFPNTIAKRTLKFSVKNLTTHNLTESTITEEAQASLWSFFECIKVSYTMPLRDDSQLYQLQCFQTKAGGKRRINVEVGQIYLRFKVKLTLSTLVELIKELSNILSDNLAEENERFSVFDHIKPITDQNLIQTLDSNLKGMLLSPTTRHAFELAYKDVGKWNEGTNIRLSHREQAGTFSEVLVSPQSPPLLHEVMDEIIRAHYNSDDISSLYLKFTVGTKNIMHPLMSFIEGHMVTDSSMSVFRHCGKWLQITHEYLTELEHQFSRIENEFTSPSNILPILWVQDQNYLGQRRDHWNQYLQRIYGSPITDSQLFDAACRAVDEGQYNEIYIYMDNILRNVKPETGYLLGDRILVRNIKLFDILHYTPDKTYLIHVKDGFGAKTIDVCSQIKVSAELLFRSHLSDSYGFLDNFFSNVNKIPSSSYREQVRHMYCRFNVQTFKQLFMRNEITFVLAYRDTKSQQTEEPRRLTRKYLSDELQRLDHDPNVIVPHLLTLGYIQEIDQGISITDNVFNTKDETKLKIRQQISSGAIPRHLQAPLMDAHSILQRTLSRHESVLAKMEVVQLFSYFDKFVTYGRGLQFRLEICNIPKRFPES